MNKKLEDVSGNEPELIERDFYAAIHTAGLSTLIPPDSVRELDAGLPGVNIGVNSLRHMISQLLKLENSKILAPVTDAKMKSNPLLEQAFEECHAAIIGYTPSRLLMKDAS